MPHSRKTPENNSTRSYACGDSVVFRRTREKFGGLSNMAGGYHLWVNGTLILSSEALYQACRFPDLPEIQRLVIAQKSPMTAKMKTKPHRDKSRPDWNDVRVKIMRWCLQVKLAQHWTTFGELLRRTGSRPIVEESRKDDFWGAKPVNRDTLTGRNVLGRLLMELREKFNSGQRDSLLRVEPPHIPDFLLFGHPVETIDASALGRTFRMEPSKVEEVQRETTYSVWMPIPEQPLLFEHLEKAPARNMRGLTERVTGPADGKSLMKTRVPENFPLSEKLPSTLHEEMLSVSLPTSWSCGAPDDEKRSDELAASLEYVFSIPSDKDPEKFSVASEGLATFTWWNRWEKEFVAIRAEHPEGSERYLRVGKPIFTISKCQAPF